MRSDASERLVLLIVCAGAALAGLDLFIVNVALPEMSGRGGDGGDSVHHANAVSIPA
jgi:hypothetical protein